MTVQRGVETAAEEGRERGFHAWKCIGSPVAVYADVAEKSFDEQPFTVECPSVLTAAHDEEGLLLCAEIGSGVVRDIHFESQAVP